LRESQDNAQRRPDSDEAIQSVVSFCFRPLANEATSLYRTTPDVKPGLRCGGLNYFLTKHPAA
jgi:hypothetical protein